MLSVPRGTSLHVKAGGPSGFLHTIRLEVPAYRYVVPRSTENPEGLPKVRFSVAMDPELAEWVTKVSGKGKRYRSRSAAVEAAVRLLKSRR